VILPYLKQAFEREGENRNQAASMLDILSRLVQEQPTAMALIRNNTLYVIQLCLGKKHDKLIN
jgi:hypothetical protein